MTEKATQLQLLKRSFTEMMKDLGTSIPGHLLAFDPDTQLAQLQIGVKRVNTKGEQFVLPPIIECPVYVFGGDYHVEVELSEGMEGVILFSQRCIDAWNDTGGVANNPILRFHDFSDAYFLPGIRSQPNKIVGYANNGIRIRNKAGDKYFWLKNDGTAEIKATTLNINGDIVHAGNTMQEGDVIHTGNIVRTGEETQVGNSTQTGNTSSTGIVSALTDVLAGPEQISSSNHHHDDSGTYSNSGGAVSGTSGTPEN